MYGYHSSGLYGTFWPSAAGVLRETCIVPKIPQGEIEVLGFLWTVQLLIFKGKGGTVPWTNEVQEHEFSASLLRGV